MMTPLRPRDKKLLVLLPSLLAAALYVFFSAIPLHQRLAAVTSALQAIPPEPELRAAIQASSAALDAARPAAAATNAVLQARLDALATESLPPSPLRLQTLANRFLPPSPLRLHAMTRLDDAPAADSPLPLPPAAERWTLRLSASYPDFLDFLQSLAADRLAIADTLSMSPPPEPGKPATWTLTLWL